VALNSRIELGLQCSKCGKQFETGLACPADGSPLVRIPTDPMVGQRLNGRFTIRSRLGAGSMGTVYRASQDAMGREIAIKILRSDRAIDDTSKARFLREARTNSALTSPHTVTVFDFGESESGELYLAMELLNGENLGQRLARQKRLSIGDAIETTRQALRSLAEAHGKGIVHRDLKPDNIFFARVQSGDEHEEIVKVLDFGIAKMMRDEDRELNAVETQAGTVFGTPRFMSPEQAQGKPLDERSDIYSLGVILYHMLTGAPPFTDEDAILVMARHIKTLPAPLTRACPEAGIPPELERLVLRVLAKDPALRPAHADAFAQELARILDNLNSSSSGMRRSAALPRKTRSIPVPPSSLDDVAEGAFSDQAENASAEHGRSGPRRGSVFVGALVGVSLLIIAGALGAFWASKAGGRGPTASPVDTANPSRTGKTDKTGNLEPSAAEPVLTLVPVPSETVATFLPQELPTASARATKPERTAKPWQQPLAPTPKPLATPQSTYSKFDP
jgi:eukaryotic-like serine/threonine-protein kinase